MIRHISLYLSFIIPICLQAQQYNAGLIPDSLKQNANAVKRFEEVHVYIKGIDKAVVKRKYAITVLNPAGDHMAIYTNGYSTLVSLSDIAGRLFDADGKLVKSVKKKDISDQSADGNTNLLTDHRVKEYRFYTTSYPYTVEFEDEQDYNGIYFLPNWFPVNEWKLSVQKSSFIVETPVGYQLRYKSYNYPGAPAVTDNGSEVYSWDLKNQKSLVAESFEPDLTEIFPIVYIGPSDFSIGKYKGDMRTWQGLGSFIAELNRSRDELPESSKKEIHKLTDAVKDPEEKIKKLYSYLQQNTRYISIQLGIGGWQPFDAKYVAERKYGDCKALSNYMVSILKEAGIKGYYVLVNAGPSRQGMGPAEDFPSPRFNHAICCVPNGGDTIWLECTNQTIAAGYMGSFTGDRRALLISDDGGHIVTTPAYTEENNLELRKINAVLDEEGNMVVRSKTHFTGIQQEQRHGLMHGATNAERQTYLNKVFSFPTYTVEHSDYTELADRIPSVDETLEVKVNNYATVSGKRMFIIPNLLNRSTFTLSDKSERRYPIHFAEAYRDSDTIFFKVPAGYSMESRPKDVRIDNKFGRYSISFSMIGDNIEVIRTEIRHKRTFPATDYPELIKYFASITRADHSKIVLVKKES